MPWGRNLAKRFRDTRWGIMQRRRLIIGLLAAVGAQAATVLPCFAATFVDQIVAQLKAQGFQKIEVETTWLGRARIEARRADFTREIVLNPTTGEILRDLWVSTSGASTKKVTIADRTDDDGTDNSGHGGGNEGSGGGSDSGDGDGGNSGSGGDDDSEDHETENHG